MNFIKSKCFQYGGEIQSDQETKIRLSGIRWGFGEWDKIYRLDQGPKAPQDDRNFIELPQNP